MTGIDTAAQMSRPWSSISPNEMRPVSGAASRAAETARPLMNATGNPARSMMRALIASWHPGRTIRPGSARSCRSRSVLVRIGCRFGGSRPAHGAGSGGLRPSVPLVLFAAGEAAGARFGSRRRPETPRPRTWIRGQRVMRREGDHIMIVIVTAVQILSPPFRHANPAAPGSPSSESSIHALEHRSRSAWLRPPIICRTQGDGIAA